MKAKVLFCSMLVLVLVGPGVWGAAGNEQAAGQGDRRPAEAHTMSFEFDAWASKDSYLGIDWDLIQIGGCVEQGRAGQPRIPHKVVGLVLPSPLERVEVSFGDDVRYEGVMLEPRAPDYLPGLGIFDPGDPLVDAGIYQKDRFIPAERYRVESLGQGKGDDNQRLWAYNVLLNPLSYNPVSGRAILRQSCELTLYYSNAPSYFPPPRGPVEKYIIVTSAAVNSSGALNSLVTWKTNKGLPAKVYTVEWINSTYTGYDTAEKIREFLKDRYWNFSAEWVQLVGDDDTVPTRYVVNPRPILPYDDGLIPTDTYYSCLDSLSTWDKEIVNNVYGEVLDTNSDGYYETNDLDDSFPDVWVARFASNNTAKVSAWATNAVNYEKLTSSATWVRSAVAIAPAANPVASGDAVKAKLEELINRTGGYYGYLGDLFGSGNVTRLYERDGNLNPTRVTSTFNSGFSLGVWMANGTSDSFNSSNMGSLLNISNANSLTNGARKPVVFGYSSGSAAFDGQECLGEALTENTGNGAMGFIGPSRTSEISAKLNYGTNPNGTGLLMDFLNMLVLGKVGPSPDNLYMGRALGNAKFAFNSSWFLDYEDALKAFYSFNLLGETNCPIWYETPKDIVPYTRTYEGPDNKTIRVQVLSSTSKPLNQSLVCVYNTSGFYASARTGEDGYAYLTAPRSVTDASMTITRPGWTPLEQTFSVTDTWAPDIKLNVTPAKNDGKDPWYKTTPQIKLLLEPMDVNSTIHYNWDTTASWLDYTPGQVLLAPDGDHQLYFYATDYIGNGNAQSWRSYQFMVDSSVPNTTARVSPAKPDGDNGWYISQPVVNFTVNGTMGYTTTWYKLDAGSFQEFLSDVAVPEGLHDISYYSETDAGNKEATKYQSFKIDMTPPTSQMAKSPQNPDGKNGWYRTFPSINIFADTPGDRIYYRWDNDTEQNYTVAMKAPEGVHTLYWQCRDEAGNREPLQNVTTKVDTLAPVTCVTTDPAEPDGQNSWFIGKATITIDPGENATAFYSWDQGLFYFCVTGPMELMEGTHTLWYYSNDTAGNHETARQRQFKLDTGVPSTNITVSPADKGLEWYTKKPRVKLETDQGARVYYYWDTDITNIQNYSKEFEVPDGERTLHFFARDDAGNKELERTKLFKVDTIAPLVAASLSTLVAEVNATVIFNLSATDANSIRDFIVDFGDGNSSGWTSAQSIEHAYTKPGNYTIYVRARDQAANEGRSSAILLEIKAPYVPPIIEPEPPEEPKTNWLPIAAGAIIALVAVAGIGAFIVSRRRSRAPPGPATDDRAELERKKALMPALYGAEGAAAAPTTAGVSGGIIEKEVGGGGEGVYMPPAATISPSGARTMNCPKCGNEVEADAEYCYTCGERWGKDARKRADADLYKPAEAPPEPVEYQQPAAPVEEAPVYQPQPAPHPTPPAQPAQVRPPSHQDRSYLIEEVPAVPVEAPAPPPGQGDDLDDILGKLQSISAPAPAAPVARHPPAHPAQARPPAQPAQVMPPAQPAQVMPPAQPAQVHPQAQPAHRLEQPRPPQRPPAAPPAHAGPPARPADSAQPTTAHTSATAQGGTGKACPKCGKEMARLVELPGAQNEQLKKLNAKGQHAFQCRACGHFEISKWP